MITHKQEKSTSANRGSSGSNVLTERQHQERALNKTDPNSNTVPYFLNLDVCTSTFWEGHYFAQLQLQLQLPYPTLSNLPKPFATCRSQSEVRFNFKELNNHSMTSGVYRRSSGIVKPRPEVGGF